MNEFENEEFKEILKTAIKTGKAEFIFKKVDGNETKYVIDTFEASQSVFNLPNDVGVFELAFQNDCINLKRIEHFKTSISQGQMNNKERKGSFDESDSSSLMISMDETEKSEINLRELQQLVQNTALQANLKKNNSPKIDYKIPPLVLNKKELTSQSENSMSDLEGNDALQSGLAIEEALETLLGSQMNNNANLQVMEACSFGYSSDNTGDLLSAVSDMNLLNNLMAQSSSENIISSEKEMFPVMIRNASVPTDDSNNTSTSGVEDKTMTYAMNNNVIAEIENSKRKEVETSSEESAKIHQIASDSENVVIRIQIPGKRNLELVVQNADNSIEELKNITKDKKNESTSSIGSSQIIDILNQVSPGRKCADIRAESTSSENISREVNNRKPVKGKVKEMIEFFENMCINQ